MTVAEQFGQNLRAARRRADLSQDGLAEKTGLHHTEISLVGRGLRLPRLETLIKLVRCTGADPSSLIEGIEWHEPISWSDTGWFTITGLAEPVGLRRTTSRGEEG